MQGSRFILWLYTLATLALAPLLNFGIGLATDYDLASFSLYSFIPVGTMALCALACSGFLFAGMRTIYLPDAVDLVFLMIVSVGAIVLTFFVEYAYLIVKGVATSEQLGGFGRFFMTSITEAQYSSYSRSLGYAPPVRAGDDGFLILFVRFAAAPAIAKIIHSTVVSRAINLS
jgi:hypothetical protein